MQSIVIDSIVGMVFWHEPQIRVVLVVSYHWRAVLELPSRLSPSIEHRTKMYLITPRTIFRTRYYYYYIS